MMMRSFAIALLTCVTLAMPNLAQAQATARVDATALGKLKKYASSKAHYDQLARMIRLVEPTSCKKIEIKKPAAARFLIMPPVFKPGETTPSGGEWQERWQIDRCGEKVLHNFHFIARQGNVPAANPLPPGDSLARPREQVITFNHVAQLLIQNFTQCKKFNLLRTQKSTVRVERTYSEKTQKQRADWDEIWHYDVCGQKKTVLVNFKSNDQGELVPRMKIQ